MRSTLLATFCRLRIAGFALVERAGHPNLLLQYDVYHAQRMSGNLAATIADRIDSDRPRPDRRQPRSKRARHRRDQLSLCAASVSMMPDTMAG